MKTQMTPGGGVGDNAPWLRTNNEWDGGECNEDAAK